jgi:hypothetical protein
MLYLRRRSHFAGHRIVVASEDEPNRPLLEAQITKDDRDKKQQPTSIVWTENNGIGMAQRFREAEGDASVWGFFSGIQIHSAPLEVLSLPSSLWRPSMSINSSRYTFAVDSKYNTSCSASMRTYISDFFNAIASLQLLRPFCPLLAFIRLRCHSSS